MVGLTLGMGRVGACGCDKDGDSVWPLLLVRRPVKATIDPLFDSTTATNHHQLPPTSPPPSPPPILPATATSTRHALGHQTLRASSVSADFTTNRQLRPRHRSRRTSRQTPTSTIHADTVIPKLKLFPHSRLRALLGLCHRRASPPFIPVICLKATARARVFS